MEQKRGKPKAFWIIQSILIMLIFSLSLIRLVNASIEEISTEQTITIKLDYKTGTMWDSDNDGIETIKGVIDFTVENSVFSWDVDENKLCTLWETYSLDNNEITTVCYGSEQCCNFVNLISSRDNWDEIFYGNYGKYGATYNNILSAKVIHVDYDLNIEHPYANISYSDWGGLSAEYINITEELDGNLDIIISTPPLFVIKKNKFDVLIILTNYGTTTLDNIPINIMLDPCLTTDDKLEQTISNLGAGESKIITLPIIRNEECSSKDYIMVTSDNKFVLKTINIKDEKH